MSDNGLTKITFLLPGHGRGAVGGYKVVYEYANRLVEAGYAVTILYPLTRNFKKRSLFKKIRGAAGIVKQLCKGYAPDKWFKLNPKVHQRWVLSLNQTHVPDSDIYVATSVETAYYLNSYNFAKDRIIYLIQGFETWAMPREEVVASYGFGFRNIVVSNWLKEILKESGNDCELVKNGFDFNYFTYSTPMEQREDRSVAFMYHIHPNKGSKDGLEVLTRLKSQYPDMKVRMFSSSKRPDSLAPWIEYHRLPDKETHNYIYNSSSVYLASSLSEGWGLTVGEAMMCGAAVVCTDTDGFKEMIEPGVNGLMVKRGDVQQMVEKISELFDDRDRRIELASKGLETIRNFTWESSARKFIEIIEQIG